MNRQIRPILSVHCSHLRGNYNSHFHMKITSKILPPLKECKHIKYSVCCAVTNTYNVEPKPSLKIRTVDTIFWIYLGILRDRDHRRDVYTEFFIKRK